MNHWNYTTEELARLWRNVGNQDIAEAYERLADAENRLSKIDDLVGEMFSGEKDSDEILLAIKKVLDE